MLFNYRIKCLLIDIISCHQISLRNRNIQHIKFNISCLHCCNITKLLYSSISCTKTQSKFPVPLVGASVSSYQLNNYNNSQSRNRNILCNLNCNNFNMDKYSIIGFDLDGTLLRYNLNNMVPLEYNVMAQYLVNNKNYSKEILNPIKDDIDFIQKGLILDSSNGNILKLSSVGDILKATHGTNKILTDNEIIKIYGPEKKWNIGSQFINNPLSTWNGTISVQIRALLDYFDMPSSLLMARAVDSINLKDIDIAKKEYNLYPDILEALIQIYKREHFADGASDYFEALKNEPEKYILKTQPFVIENLKELKKTKATFLLTGSNIDFANLTATYALGENWRDLFDVVITFARKPWFFTDNRSFYNVENNKETSKIDDSDIKLGNIYSQGNWSSLEKLLATKFGDNNGIKHKSLYIGDNLIQDIYTPKKFANIDTIAVAEELLNEEMYAKANVDKFLEITKSKLWGSYFVVEDEPTFWSDIIKNYATICVPTIDCVFKK